MKALRLTFLLPLALLACGTDDHTDTHDDDDDTSEAPVDIRVQLEPAGSDELRFWTGEMTVPGFADKQFCFVSTYQGPTIGIQRATMVQNTAYGHHVLLYSTSLNALDYPDGTAFDCTDAQAMNQAAIEPLIIPGSNLEKGFSEMILPEGTAVRFTSGQRYLVQSHYVNYAERPLLAQDVIALRVLPVDQVKQWASSWSHAITNMPLPAGQSTSLELECTWEKEVSLLFLTGHMHEHGTSFSVDMIDGETAETARIYDVPEWRVEYRDVPIVNRYEEGEFVVRPGDTFITTCNFFNDTDHLLDFPEEMCAATGMVAPAEAPVLCIFR